MKGDNRGVQPHTFSTRAAARILAVSPERIRYWVRRKLISPASHGGRRYRFGFSDLLVMRMAKDLLPTRRHLEPFRRCFDSVLRRFDGRRPVTALKLQSEDGIIVVRDHDVVYEAESGQLLLFSETPQPAGRIEDRFGPARVRARFDEARRMAEADPMRALVLYSDLINREPNNFELHLRMAALLEREGDLAGAVSHLHGAALLVPGNADVHLRLGLLYRKREETELAVQSFTRVIDCDPTVVEAHRHLADLYERLGRKRDALKHLSAINRISRDF
jgi:tetratricopeptide (TPR) repeat protein